MSPEEIVRSTAFRYITDAITKEEALELLKAKQASKAEREKKVREVGCVHAYRAMFAKTESP